MKPISKQGASEKHLFAHIEASPLFTEWTALDKQRLAETAFNIQLMPSQALYTRGEAAKGLYLVLSGSIKVMVPTIEGEEAIIDVLGPGQWLGELSLIDGQPRQHSAIALEQTNCVRFEKALIDAVLQANPALYRGIALLLCERLRAMYVWGEESLLSSVSGRILHRFRHIASGVGEPLDDGYLIRTRISQELLAAMLGVTRQTLNKEMAGLKRLGLVRKVGAYYWVKQGAL